MERKEKYKNQSHTSAEIRHKRRHKQTALRKERRDQLLKGKRMRLASTSSADLSTDQVIEAAKSLQTKPENKCASLRIIRKAFAQGTALIDAFLSVDNSMPTLVGLLTGSDAEVQLEAAWCLTNMAAGTDDNAMTVAKHAGAYLITYLSSENVPLQDQCAWAIGNIAGGGEPCREVLKAQGALQPLIKLLESSVPSVVKSAAFGLSNLSRDPNTQSELVASNVLPLVANYLVYSPNTEQQLISSEVAWILTYLATSGKHTAEIAAAGILNKLAEVINNISVNDKNNFQLLTPMLRSLGNLACCMQVDATVCAVCEEETLIKNLVGLLTSDHHHICVETLWVMSNITVSAKTSELVKQFNGLPCLISLLSSTIDICHEAFYCLCNVATHGEAFCTALFDLNIMEAIIPHLRLNSPDNAFLGLCLLQMLLAACPQAKEKFEACRGLDKLEALEYCNNEQLCGKTNEILEQYFYKDDDDANAA